MSNDTDLNKDRNAYPLNRDLLASSRLHLQHYLWVTSLGYHLHPSIPCKENTQFAEIGCGTGILSLELAKQLPAGSTIQAYDLSLEQCPPRGWWPENITFNELDIFERIPQKLIGVYDVVFLRHFVCVVQSGNPMPLLSALLKLLKPGGYLQWQEWDLQTNKVVIADSANSAAETAPKMRAYMESIYGPESLQAQTSWVRDFHTRFRDAGAELIAYERHGTAPEVMLLTQEVGSLGAREWVDNLRARDPASAEAAKYEKFANEAFEECSQLQRGTTIDTEKVTWVVRKK